MIDTKPQSHILRKNLKMPNETVSIQEASQLLGFLKTVKQFGKPDKPSFEEARFQATLRTEARGIEETAYQRRKDYLGLIQAEQEKIYTKEKYNLEKLLDMRTHVASSAELDIIDSQILGIGQRVKSLTPIISPALRIAPRTELDIRGIEYDREFGRSGPEPVMNKEVETWENYGTRKLDWLKQKARRDSYVMQRKVDAPSSIQIASAELEGVHTPVFATRRKDGNVEVGTAESLFQMSEYAKHFDVSTQDIARWGNRVPLGIPVAGKINGKNFSRQQWLDLRTREVVWDTTPISGRTKSVAGVVPGAQLFDEEVKDIPVPASVQAWLEGLGAVNTGDPTAPIIGDMYKGLLEELKESFAGIIDGLPAGSERQHLQRLLTIRQAQADALPGISGLDVLNASFAWPWAIMKLDKFLYASPAKVHETVGKTTQKYLDANINSYLPDNWTLRFVPHGAIERLSLGEAVKGIGKRGLVETYHGLTNFTTSQLGLGHFVAVHYNEIVNLKDMGRYFVDDNDVIKDAYGRKQPFKRGVYEEIED